MIGANVENDAVTCITVDMITLWLASQQPCTASLAVTAERGRSALKAEKNSFSEAGVGRRGKILTARNSGGGSMARTVEETNAVDQSSG